MKAKKFLAVLLALLMLAMTIPFATLTASAAAPASYTDISAEQSVSVSVNGNSRYYRFVPTQSGTYRFYSYSNSGDPYVCLLDASGTQITHNDDSGGGLNFSLEYDCTAGTTYYIRATEYGMDGSASYSMKVELVAAAPVTPAGDIVEIDTANGTSYSLFNSGATASDYSDSVLPNPAPATHNNNGYDLRGSIGSARRFRLGRSFTVNTEINEQATLNVYAYDVDEDRKPCGHGYEYDYIYLMDETAGTSVCLDGHMSGQNNTWNNSVFSIDPELLEYGHTYHFELNMTCTGSQNCGYYAVIVRTVSLIINGEGGGGGVIPAPEGIENADLFASISSSGRVSVNLTANAYAEDTYSLEYKAVYLASGDQLGGMEYSVTIPTTEQEYSTSFQLESGAPRGTYEITVFIKLANEVRQQDNTRQAMVTLRFRTMRTAALKIFLQMLRPIPPATR